MESVVRAVARALIRARGPERERMKQQQALRWQASVEECVTGLGYELVETEWGPAGLLRVYIDLPSGDGAAAVRIEDCERVSHQLSHVLTVEDLDYRRLEVSSPGLDRPLRKATDFDRFAGARISLKLRRPIEGRRNFEGVLSVEPDGRYGLEYDNAPKPETKAPGAGGRRTPSVRTTKQAAKVARKLVFALDEIDRARLMPELEF